MKEIVINYGPILAYILLSYGTAKQILRIFKKRKADQISWVDVVMRLMATLIFFLSFILMRNIYLLIGNSVLLSLSLFYIGLIFKFKK